MKKYPYLNPNNTPEGTTHIFTGSNPNVNHPPTPDQFEKISDLKIQEWNERKKKFIDHINIIHYDIPMKNRVSVEYYLENMEKPWENGDMKKRDFETGMIVATKFNDETDRKNYGVIIKNNNDICIRYFEENRHTSFDSFDIINDDLKFDLGYGEPKGGIVEVYKSLQDSIRQTPFTQQQFDWAIQSGFYEKIWECKYGELIPNGSILIGNFTGREYIISIQKEAIIEKVSIINLKSGERIVNDVCYEKNSFTKEKLNTLIKDFNLSFYLKG